MPTAVRATSVEDMAVKAAEAEGEWDGEEEESERLLWAGWGGRRGREGII